MAAKFVVQKSSDGQFFYNLKAANGETILTSEMYIAKSGAQKGIDSVKTNAPLDERYERRTSGAGQPYFVLKAANHEIVGTSETYSTNAAMENGIEAVKQNATTTIVEDLTAE